MVNEFKYVLLGLAVTTATFCLGFAFAWTLKYYNGAALVVAFLGLSYWASRMVRDYYEN